MSPRAQKLLFTSILLLALLMPACTSATPATVSETPAVISETSTPPEPSIAKPELLFSTTYEDEKVHSVAFSPDGKIVAGGSYLEARLWHIGDGRLADVIEYEHSVGDLAFSPDGSLLGAGQGVYGVRLMRVADGEEHLRLHTGYDNRLAFAPNGETIATGNRSGTVWLWRVADGEQIAEFKPPINEWISALAFSPNGESIAAGHLNGTIFLWRVRDGQLLHTLSPQTSYSRANALAFSPDGEFLAVAGERQEHTNVVRLWRVADGNIYQDLPLNQEAHAVAFSPNGRWLAAGSQAELAIWALPEFTLQHTLDHVAQTGKTDWITSLDFSPDSALLAAGRWVGVLEIWQLVP